MFDRRHDWPGRSGSGREAAKRRLVLDLDEPRPAPEVSRALPFRDQARDALPRAADHSREVRLAHAAHLEACAVAPRDPQKQLREAARDGICRGPFDGLLELEELPCQDERNFRREPRMDRHRRQELRRRRLAEHHVVHSDHSLVRRGRTEESGRPEELARSEDGDRDLIRSLARRLAEDGPDASRLRAVVNQTISGEPPRKGGILEALRRSPLVGADIAPVRRFEAGRKVEL